MKPEDLKLQICPAPVLWEKGQLVKDFDDLFRAGIQKMLDIVEENDGLGISAHQVGWPVQVFITRLPYGINHVTEVYVNAIVTPVTTTTRFSLEGCLSFPGIDKTIKRYTEVRVKYKNIYGLKRVKTVKKWLNVRCIQHEYQHTKGRPCFTEKEYANYLKENEGKTGTVDPVVVAGKKVSEQGIYPGIDLEPTV